MKNIGKIIIAIILLICIIWIAVEKYNAENGKTARITIDGNTAYNISLDDDRIFEISGSNDIKLKIECCNGEIRVLSSECPDKICEQKGYISMTNENIVCLPAKVIITVEEEE